MLVADAPAKNTAARARKITVTALVAAQLVLSTPATFASPSMFGINPGVLGGIDAITGSQCGSTQSSFAGSSDSAPSVGGYMWDQLDDSRKDLSSQIVKEAERRGLPERAAVIAISTAIVETGIQNLDYGDDIHGVRNPDGTLTSSLGLFQQQKWWGSREDRLNPSKSAGFFYDALVKIPNWQGMEEGAAAQAVQVSAFPSKYTVQVPAARSIVEGVTGGSYTPAKVAEDDDKDAGNSSDSSAPTSNSGCANGAGGTVGEGVEGAFGEGNDYPLTPRALQKMNLGFGEWGFDPTLDPWGTYTGQCVSWVMWRLNKQLDSTGEPWKLTAAGLGTAGRMNGYQMSDSFASAGYKTDMKPARGSVAWWGANAHGMGPYGHVAIVEEVDLESNRVYISQYNAGQALTYSEQWWDIDKISGFIHVADIKE